MSDRDQLLASLQATLERGPTSAPNVAGMTAEVPPVNAMFQQEAGFGNLSQPTGLLTQNLQGMAPTQPANYGQRTDGSNKGRGYLGELQRPDGSISTELSIQFSDVLGGRPFPLLVPTLDKAEIDHLLSGARPTPSIIDKAISHAELRTKNNLSPFAD